MAVTRTAHASGRLYLYKEKQIVRFEHVDSNLAGHAYVQGFSTANAASYYRIVPLTEIDEIDQDVARALLLLQTGVEL